MTDKLFVKPAKLVRDSFRLARLIYDSGFRPDVLLALWRGGTPVGAVVHEFLLYHGIQTYHTAVKAESYHGIGLRTTPVFERLDLIARQVRKNANVLIVDDIFDSGTTLSCLKTALAPRTHSIRTATLYCKNAPDRKCPPPDYHLIQTDAWVVFPHELVGLSPAEIKAKDPALLKILNPTP